MDTIDPDLGLEKRILQCNTQAMDQLRKDQFESALSLLMQAEALLSPALPSYQRLEAITLNNLGCYYHRMRRPAVALTYLTRALHTQGDTEIIAAAHLNACSIRSSLGSPEKALSHALKAIQLLSEVKNLPPSALSTLLMSYRNAGQQHERLRQYADAADCYTQGYIIAKRRLGPAHPLAYSLKRAGVLLQQEMKGDWSHWGRNPTPNNTRKGDIAKSPLAMPLPRVGSALRRRRNNRVDVGVSFESHRDDQSRASGPLAEAVSVFSSHDNLLRALPTERGSVSHRQRPRTSEKAKPPMTDRQVAKSYRTKKLEEKSTRGDDRVDQRMRAIEVKLAGLEGALRRFEECANAVRSSVRDITVSAAVVTIQKWIRGWFVRKRHQQQPIRPLPPALPKGAVFQRKSLRP